MSQQNEFKSASTRNVQTLFQSSEEPILYRSEYPTPPDSCVLPGPKFQQLTPVKQHNPSPTFSRTPRRPANASPAIPDASQSFNFVGHRPYIHGSANISESTSQCMVGQSTPQLHENLYENFTTAPIRETSRFFPHATSNISSYAQQYPTFPITATPAPTGVPIYNPRTLIYDRNIPPPLPTGYPRPIVRRAVELEEQPHPLPVDDVYSSDNSTATLCVTNLDYNITSREWPNILYRELYQLVRVLDIDIQTQPDGSLMALVRVPSEDDARYVISKCQRKKIGYKRIQLSLHKTGCPRDPQRLRAEVMSILNEVSARCMPLFKFVENFEKRFYRGISVAELYNMKDTVEIKDSVASSGRTVCLQASLSLPQTASTRRNLGAELQFPQSSYCTMHCSPGEFTIIEDCGMLPYVKVDLDTFAHQVGVLLTLHSNDMHLMSFKFCYEAIYTKLVETADGGVPLEHLISCVSNVYIRVDSLGVKKILLQENSPSSPASSAYSEASNSEMSQGRSGHALNQQLSQFAREVVDLLKRMPGCQMSFSKFIPSYHHHFGRQCRVADFGFTKLQELFEAIPHVLQILGTGSQRILYLTHRIHMRRFIADLCRVLKAQPEKTSTIEDFPEHYSEVIGTDLNISSFGVCYIMDMLMGIPETTVLVEGKGDSARMSIPKKDQTPDEIRKTKQFAYEVINLLKNCSQCTMVFNKFIPAYHHHFGRQCRVADYGFAKLLELFEAIPDVVTVRESGEERYISLTSAELYKVLSEHILKILKNSTNKNLEVKQLGPTYQKVYGHSMHIEEFGATSVEELIEKVPHIAHMEHQASKDLIVLNDKSNLELLATKCLEILIIKSSGSMETSEFMEKYSESYGDTVDLVKVKHTLYPAISITQDEKSGVISLHSLLAVAQRVLRLLRNCQGKLNFLSFEITYTQFFGVKIEDEPCGFPGLTVLLQIMDFMVSVRGRGVRQTILLRQDHISRLAHQLAYKVGIYTELERYKCVPRKAIVGSSSTGSSEGAAINESIVAGSPDVFNNEEGGKITRCPPFTMSDFPPINSFKPNLEQTRRTLSNLGLTNQQEYPLLQSTQPAAVPENIRRNKSGQSHTKNLGYFPSADEKDEGN